MAQSEILAAKIRERAGKGAARVTRREGRVPGVVYGDNKDPLLISVHPVELMKLAHKPGFFSHVSEVEANGSKHKVLARDLQFHPVTDQPLHVDFMRISRGATVTVEVEVVFENEDKCPGQKGGVLNIVRHAVEMTCSTDAIPETLVADLTGLDFGDSIHISAIAVPEGCRRPLRIATSPSPRWPPPPNSRRRWPRPKAGKTARARKAAKSDIFAPSGPGSRLVEGWDKEPERCLFVGLGIRAGLAPKTDTISDSWRWTRLPAAMASALSSKVSGRYFRRPLGRDKGQSAKAPDLYERIRRSDRKSAVFTKFRPTMFLSFTTNSICPAARCG